MANFLVGLFLMLMLLFFWSRTFWYIVGWLLGTFLWGSAFGYALSLMFGDQSATPYIWGSVLGVPLWCIISFFFSCFAFTKEPEPYSWDYQRNIRR